MANIIERVQVTGFWGEKSVDVRFSALNNFIIGVNGSGKTTFINLLSGCLRLDFDVLNKIAFDEIIITLKTLGKNQKPIIRVKKTSVNEYLSHITYVVKTSTSGAVDTYDFEDFADIAFARRRRNAPSQDLNHASLRNQLRSLVELSWLPLWRFQPSRALEFDERMPASVEAKLEQVKKDFATYFSSLQAKAQRETDLFQEKIFLSLIHQADRRAPLTTDIVDLVAEQAELEAIFKEFNMDRAKYRRSIVSHFENVKTAVSKIKRESSESLSQTDFVSLIDNQRIHRLVHDWRQLQKTRKDIYFHRSMFISILDDLFTRKTVRITDRNEIEIVTQSGKPFGPDVLSSGEKQLFVMLGEVLLFEQRPFVLIADEPELSLHVAWQSALVESIRLLSGRVQIIFATHSPDIVGENEADIIELEEHIL
ncbi:AAA family ATPase [uncultured Agrobacterium sp.]|uniref:AAA family ATPase n=1 Tax=uncultured Agrobacterium sp. TaxID=157277 RepID=UPI0025F79790|nr:AAA family ATPase [uncultured Agrobacterium sp.]